MPNVFITGAAQGFGRAIAEKFAAAGFTVGAYDINADLVHEWVSARSSAAPGRVVAGELDVTKPEQWEDALASFAKSTTDIGAPSLNVLVNNAGILYAGDFIEEGSANRDSALVDINLKGTLFGSRAAFPYLKAAAHKGQSAQVINLASASAIYGTPHMATYSSTKFAVRGITEALNVEWEPYGILVSDILPLYARTAMLDGVSTAGIDRLGATTTPEGVADVVLKTFEAGRTVPAKVHNPVGWQSKLLFNGSLMSPAFLTRFVNSKLVFPGKIKF